MDLLQDFIALLQSMEYRDFDQRELDGGYLTQDCGLWATVMGERNGYETHQLLQVLKLSICLRKETLLVLPFPQSDECPVLVARR